MINSEINLAFMQLSKRAESENNAKLVETFVNVGPLFAVLSTVNHQIIYGRRGTGKTHAFKYLAQKKRDSNDLVAEIDMRRIGSSSGFYGDPSIPLAQRATMLLSDTLSAIHDELRKQVIKQSDRFDMSELGPILIELAAAISKIEVFVVGAVESETTNTADANESGSLKAGFDISSKPGLKVEGTAENKHKNTEVNRVKETGTQKVSLRYGDVSGILEQMSDLIGNSRIWVFLDEWSNVAPELQPYLADCLRHCIMSVPKLVVKIASIEQRSRFSVLGEDRRYIGFELGSDIAADISLDDFMVFNNENDAAQNFFKELLLKHFRESFDGNYDSAPKNADDLIRQAFTQRTVFNELVRAAEGVPRDAISIIGRAAQKANDKEISSAILNDAALQWYQLDKEAPLRSNKEARDLLNWIIDEVIRGKQVRAFLLRNHVDDFVIGELFDARLLHVIKRNVSSQEELGVRYNVYQLDFGCYIDLKNTSKYPKGQLLLTDEHGKDSFTEVTDVHSNDYRKIRRSVLNLEAFRNRTHQFAFE